MGALPAGGAMVAIEATEAEVKDSIADREQELSLAGINGPTSVVLSGEEQAVEELEVHWSEQGRRTKRLDVSHAFHSPLMEPMQAEFEAVAKGLDFSAPQIPIVSTLTGELLSAEEATDPAYWVRQVREAVRFADAVSTLSDQGASAYLELGPDGVLSAMAASCLPEGSEAPTVPLLRGDRPEPEALLGALASVHTHGADVDWSAFFKGTDAKRVSLPTYPFQRQRFWLDPSFGIERGRRTDGADEPFWTAVATEDATQLADLLRLTEREGELITDEVVAKLSAWRREQRQRSKLEDHRYRIAWEPVEAAPGTALSGHWVAALPAEAGPSAALVLNLMRQQGAQVSELALAPGEIDRTAIADRLRAIAAADGSSDSDSAPAIAGVISLLALDDDAGSPLASDSTRQTLTLSQALGDAELEARLWLCTQGAVAPVEEEPSQRPLGALAWGLGRVIGAEEPQRWGGLLDLPVEVDEASAERLAIALAGGFGAENELALRAGGAFVPRLAPVSATTEAAPAWQSRGTVLITNGLGSMGRELATRLAVDGAEHLILTTRPGAGDRQALEDELAETGTEVTVVECDAGDATQLGELLAGASDRFPLTAVFGLGRGGADTMTAALLPEQLSTGLVAAREAFLLDELTRDLGLEEFALCFDFGALLGVPGLGCSALASAFAAAVIECRRGLGLPARGLAWGDWAGADADPERLESSRHGIFSPGAGLLADALRGAQPAAPVLAVAEIEWERLVRVHAPRTIATLPEVEALLGDGADAGQGQHSLEARLATVPEPERPAMVLKLVRADVAAVLGHASGADVEPEKSFKDLGFDSLAAVELRNRLVAATGLALAATTVFDYPSPADLARHLLSEAGGAAARVSVVRATASDEPIAIVGMACRYPGGASSPAALWDLVANGVDGVGGLPRDRGWDLEGLYDPDPDHLGTSYAREGGFLYDAPDFDADFFGISPREALAMDPQQRLLLEACWEALEDAGVDPGTLRGSATGVFAGASMHDYFALEGFEELEGYVATGSAGSVLSGRVSYSLGLEGPAVTVDTACSSSLVALHLAAQALRTGECSLALAGGVTILSTPMPLVEFSRQRILSPDGRCKAFSAEASGMGWAEGVGMLLVERLSDAARNGHPILATMRGSAVNQDGASNGLTAPNGPSQERVIAQALANAGLSPHEVDAVEAHGTGTPLGDPIEAQALLATYGADRGESGPLRLGSLKSNIGHTQAAAGVGGVIKMVQALRHGVLPKTLHAEKPSPYVDWSSGAVELLTEAQPWEPGERPRRAGISSFGISGTNAHVIVEQAPAPAPDSGGGETPGQAPPLSGTIPLALSAKSQPALAAAAARLAAALREDPELDPVDAGFSLAGERALLSQRAVAFGPDREALLAGLDELGRGEDGDNAVSGRANSGPIAFLFTGQGAQWEGMAAELLDSAPVFATEMAACEAALAPFVEWSLEDVLRRRDGAPSLERVDVVQPALFAVMVSLAALWRSLGIQPAVVVGHSQGEIAAAHVAGGLSLEDAARIVALRSQALVALAGKGGMVSLALDAAAVRELIAPWDGRISVAAENGPRSVVVSGEVEALEELLAACEEGSVRARRIPVDYAAHSAQIEVLREQLLEAFAPIEPRSGDVPFHSTVTGEPIDTAELDAEYWYRNLRETVRLEPVVRALLKAGQRTLLEVSSHPSLAVSLRETVEASDAVPDTVAIVGSLHRDGPDTERFLASLAAVHAHGAGVDWSAFFAGSGAKRVSLPTYAFQRRRFWVEPSAPRVGEAPAAAAPEAATPAPEAAAGPASLASELAATPESEREAVVLALVRDHAAVVLGHDSAAELEPDRLFVELGLDSLGAVKLRERLARATGLELPISLFMEDPSPRDTAKWLLERIGDPDTASTGGDQGTLAPLLASAHSQRRLPEFFALAASAASFREVRHAHRAEQAKLIELARGEGELDLVLWPSIAAISGPHEYVRLAGDLTGLRQVSTFAIPGFAADEPLPADLLALAEMHADLLGERFEPGELALGGHSSGGWFAHLVAGILEQRGAAPAALVLIDSYDPGSDAVAAIEYEIFEAVAALGEERAAVSDARLTAMAVYRQMFREWQPKALASPTILIRAAEPPAAENDEGEPIAAAWMAADRELETPGDHLSMMSDYAESTASLVVDLLLKEGLNVSI